MRTTHKNLIGRLLAVMLALASLAPGMVAAQEYGSVNADPSGGDMLADAFLIRPVMIVGTVFTTATFIVTLPFSALGGNVGEAADTLVAEPFKYTFARPLGEEM